MEAFGLTPRVVQRKKHVTLYAKDPERIFKLSAFWGGTSAHAANSGEHPSCKKECAIRLTALVNCQTANMDKTLEAAFSPSGKHQAHCSQRPIRITVAKAKREMAGLQLQYPYASLKERLGYSIRR